LSRKTAGKKRVIFAGGGHANIAALRRLAKDPPDAELILVNHGPKIWYTGALPALVRGDISEDEACLNAPRLAESCNATFIDASLTAYETNRLTLDRSPGIPFDILAISTGAAPNGGVKPIPSFLARIKTWDRMPNPTIGIIGAGAGGVELALALRHRLGAKAQITLQARDNTVLAMAPRGAQQTARAKLAKAGITVTETLPTTTDLIHAYTPTPTIQIRPTLQLDLHDNILATGDCAAFPTKLPRSGAIAVQQGRTLATNIRKLLANKPPIPFHPPRNTLAILSLNADEATAWYGKFSWTGHLPMSLKSRIDAKWLEGAGF